MLINDKLHELVNQAINRGEDETNAWVHAYEYLTQEGILTNRIIFKNNCKNHSDIYIFAHSIDDNTDYTYVSAKYRNGNFPINLNLYDKFYDKIKNFINNTIEDKHIKFDMYDGLGVLFSHICVDYVRQFDKEVNDRLIINEIPIVKHYYIKANALIGLLRIFKKYKIKHCILEIDENNNALVGKFTPNGLTVISSSIYWTINKDNGLSTIDIF